MNKIKSSTDLNSQIYQDGLLIRKAVFVKEQNVPQELKVAGEQDCTYFVLYRNDQAAGVARYYPTDDNGVHVQRVAILKEFRHQGLASELLNFISKQAKSQGYQYIILGAQDQAHKFYESLGFQTIGDQFEEAGILHHEMRKDL